VTVTLRRRVQAWTGPKPEWWNLVPNKPLLRFNGQPIWAEFIVLRELEAEGWQGVWINAWRRAYWRNPGEVAAVPAPIGDLIDRIAKRTGRRGGCWDICAWRGAELRFIELKQRDRDELRPTQRAWRAMALEEGVPLSAFAIVEWET
jgi:hypothetical protein